MQSVIRTAFKRISHNTGTQRRYFSANASEEEMKRQVTMWRNITCVMVPMCMGLFIYDFFIAPPEEHHEKPPAYPYLRIRNKDFPWGNCALLEKDCEN